MLNSSKGSYSGQRIDILSVIDLNSVDKSRNSKNVNDDIMQKITEDYERLLFYELIVRHDQDFL